MTSVGPIQETRIQFTRAYLANEKGRAWRLPSWPGVAQDDSGFHPAMGSGCLILFGFHEMVLVSLRLVFR